MDTKHDDSWFGKVEVYGVGEPKIFEGAIATILRDALIWLMGTPVRNGVNGKEIKIILRDKPMSESKEGGDMISHQAMNELLEGALQEGTPEYDEFMATLKPTPWQNESVWQRFLYLQARQVNFESAPDEYLQLWDYLEAKYPEHWRTLKKRSH